MIFCLPPPPSTQKRARDRIRRIRWVDSPPPPFYCNCNALEAKYVTTALLYESGDLHRAK